MILQSDFTEIEDDIIEDNVEDNEQESVPTLSHSPTPEESPSSEASTFEGFPKVKTLS